jgi:hypothetical protein
MSRRSLLQVRLRKANEDEGSFYVPGLKNLLSISALDEKGYRVACVDGQVLM